MRRTQLPRIQLKALEEPDFAPVSVKPASQPARRGPPSGRGGVGYLSRQRIAPVRGHARQWRIRASRATPGRRARLNAHDCPVILSAGPSAPRPHGPRRPPLPRRVGVGVGQLGAPRSLSEKQCSKRYASLVECKDAIYSTTKSRLL